MANFFKPAVKAKQTAQQITVRIDKLDMNGVAVSRWNKKPLFIQGALPGEVVEVKVFEQKNKYAKAKLLTIKEQSEARVKPECQHFSVCGGCDLQMSEFSQQIEFKKDKVTALFSRNLVPANIATSLPWQPTLVGEPYHYRRKARIGVQFNKHNEATIGFRQKSTNHLAAIKSCPVLVEPLTDIFTVFNELITQLTIKSAIGHLEVIYANVADSDKKITVIVRQLKPLSSADMILWESYADRYQWHVIFDHGNHQQTLCPSDEEPFQSADIGSKSEQLSQTSSQLNYQLTNGLQIDFAPSDFIQVNEHINNVMIEQALSWLKLTPDDKVLDLFCGLGNFSLALAQQVSEVVGVEGVQAMVDKAQDNANKNNLNNCQFFQADLNSDWLNETWAVTAFDKVLLDPARAGAEQAVEQIAQLKIPTILYVSCEPTTLARDCQILVSHGYAIERISLIDMFSQTKHVETMVLLNRTL
ncbi:23S rRNA (uracil(1939)-C(5))-methyltransferase RlmD [Colwellia asteriadis]|uniref:23S rRNA (uracil(1939)-C(5))-methyltransferase RlmD n=1 Tax=Colwellia asteriadis TaxID=517723 RepID=A0ABN1L952_9GAMM